MDRRTMLIGVGTVLATLAGCTGASTEGTPTDSATPTSTPTPTPAPPRITDQSLEAREQCEEPDAATITTSGDAVVVEGCIVGKDGCQRPVLESARYDERADELQVRVTTEAPSDAEVCTQQLVDLPYRVTVTFANGRPGTTTVVHDGANGEQQAGEAETGRD